MGCLGLPLLVGVAPALRSVLVRTWRTTAAEERNGLDIIKKKRHYPDTDATVKPHKRVHISCTYCGGPGAPGGPGLYGLGL